MPWQIVDYQVFFQTAQFAFLNPGNLGGAFVAVIQLPAVGGGQLWRAERVSCQVALPFADQEAAPGITCSLYDQVPSLLGFQSVGPAVANRSLFPITNVAPADSTVAGQLDISDDGSPITVREGGVLCAIFVSTNASIETTPAQLRAQVAVMQGVAGAPTPVAGAGPGSPVPANI